MNFTQAIASGFQNYVNFSGRAARSEYWFWTLFTVLVSIAALLIDLALFGDMDVSFINGIVSLGLFLPSLAVAIRRLHDLDRTRSAAWPRRLQPAFRFVSACRAG